MSTKEPTVLDPASLDDMPLLDERHDSGGAFTLNNEARESASAQAEDGWEVEVGKGSKIVVARGAGAASAADAFSKAIRAAQRGLDLLSIRGRGDLLIRHAEDEHVLWWSTSGQKTLRTHAVASLRFDLPPITARVTDASGKERVTPPEAEPVWHPSFRYFRLAQVSEEVFDAYRNLFLALESILSTATPYTGGSEPDWVRRALREAEAKGLALATYAPNGAPDPAEGICGDLYTDTRTATFHAKTGRPTLLPLDAVDRENVLDSLERLAALYLALAQQELGARRSGGAIAKGGFDLMVGRLVDELQIHVTDDPIRMDESQTVINPGGGCVVALATRPAPELDQHFVRMILAETSVDALSDLTHVARLATVDREGTPVSGGQLEGRLTLGGFDHFQAAMGVRGLNVRTPRSFFAR